MEPNWNRPTVLARLILALRTHGPFQSAIRARNSANEVKQHQLNREQGLLIAKWELVRPLDIPLARGGL
jgi:hypothetical protein